MIESSSAPDRAFGIFDWVDDTTRGPKDVFDVRLRMTEYADTAGFYAYHVAEHHGTPLGYAPSPNVLLAAVASHTTLLRISPMVNIVPLYEPMRLLEEICMLDQLSGGRLDLGLGRGAVPYELQMYGTGADDQTIARARYDESFEMLMQGLQTGTVTFTGQHFRADHATLAYRTYQRPYPPLWYPTANPASMRSIGERNLNTLFFFATSNQQAADFVAEYQQARAAGLSSPNRLNPHVAEPKIGVIRHIYVAETDEAAEQAARPALTRFLESFNYMFVKHRGAPPWRLTYDSFVGQGLAIVGKPDTIRVRLGTILDEVNGNYFCGVFAFGNLTADQVLQSIGLFAREVKPALTSAPRRPGVGAR